MSKLPTVKELESFFNDFKKNGFPEKVRLDQCTLVIDCEMMIDSHLSVLKANSGNRVVMPFYERILKLYKILKNGKDS